MNDRAAMRKVLEYLAVGRAVVQFPLAEMSRLCGDATLYPRQGDARDLADRIAELLDDSALRERLGAAGRQRVHDGLMSSDQVPSLMSALELAARADEDACRSPGRSSVQNLRSLPS